VAGEEISPERNFGVLPAATPCRASHVNAGTSVPAEDLPWTTTMGRVMRLPKVHLEVNERSTVTPYGGLTLVTEFLRKFGVADRINQAGSPSRPDDGRRFLAKIRQ
jgi:hypothetical protein